MPEIAANSKALFEACQVIQSFGAVCFNDCCTIATVVIKTIVIIIAVIISINVTVIVVVDVVICSLLISSLLNICWLRLVIDS